MLNKKYFKEQGKLGAKKRWDKVKETRKDLIEKVSSQVDKEILNLIQEHMSNEQIVRLIKAWEQKNG